MDSTVATHEIAPAAVASRPGLLSRLFTGRQGRRTREALLAYAFLFPAFLIVGAFGLFPLLFAAYQSTLKGLNKVVGEYDGLANYVKAIANLTYVLFFWLAALLIFLAVLGVVRELRAAREKGANAWRWSPAGIAIGAACVLWVLFIIRALPAVLNIPSQMRGKANTPENFRRLLLEALTTPEVLTPLLAAFAALLVGVFLLYWVSRAPAASSRPSGNYAGAFIAATVMLAGAALLIWLTWTEINSAYAEALEAGEGLEIWPQIIMISAGFMLLLLAWWLWQSAAHRTSNVSMALRLGAAAMLLVGGWFLIGELPRAIAAGDPVWWYGLLATFWYSLGAVPIQLAIALFLAALLFQDIRGKQVFRVIYFIPYIAPFVGTAAVFRLIFSARPDAPVNSLITTLGGSPQQWLNQPKGIFQMMLGDSINLPVWASGPSLALVVIMIYGIWTFIGFNTVIFMAGLGNIPREMYEAASIDGGGRWAHFRHITLPLLSPTIYFLTLYAVIGTFKAFNHIYVLRTAAALGTTDTASIVIFQVFKRDTRYGYASALAILLLIIILGLTAFNNWVASKRVYYG